MKRTIATLFIVAISSASFAQPVASPHECPAGTTAVHANYTWQDGRFVRDGWVCEKIEPRS